MKEISRYRRDDILSRYRLLWVVLAMMLFSSIKAQNTNLEQVLAAMDRQDYGAAMDALNREIAEKPSNAYAYHYRAWVYFNQYDDLTNALRDVNTALDKYKRKEKSGKEKSHRLRANIYLALHDREKAMYDFERALKLNPKNLELLLERADAFYENHDYANAEKDYYTALHIDPAEGRIYAGLSRVEMAQEKWDAARFCLDKLIRLSPDYVTGYEYRAILEYKTRNYDKAIDDILRAYILSDEDADILDRFFRYAEKNLDLAVAMVSEMIRQRGAKGNGYFIRAGLYEKKNQLALAIGDYNKMMELADASQIPRIKGYRSACFFKAGSYEQALADINTWKDSDSTNAYMYYSRSEIFRSLGEHEKAMDDLDKAIVLSPTEGWFYYARALLKRSIKGYTNNSVLDDFSQSISLNPSVASILLSRGYFYLTQIKDSINANADFRQVLNIDRGVTSTGTCRPVALMLLGAKTEALSSMESALQINNHKDNFYRQVCLAALQQNEEQCIISFNKAVELGFRDFDFMHSDPLLKYFTENPRLNKYLKDITEQHREKLPDDLLLNFLAEDASSVGTATIPMKARGGGVYEISCKVNELKLSFIFDTGASDISISQTEASFMLKNGYLLEQDILGTRQYLNANGMIDEGTRVLLKKVDFGGLILNNVTASVVNSKTAPLLFGQSALAKYARIVIDNAKGEITITRNK